MEAGSYLHKDQETWSVEDRRMARCCLIDHEDRQRETWSEGQETWSEAGQREVHQLETWGGDLEPSEGQGTWHEVQGTYDRWLASWLEGEASYVHCLE